MWRSVKKWLLGWWRGGPHFVVGPPANPYLKRWYILPRNPWLNIYLHQFLRDDDDRACHDHPWYSLSLLLVGSYREQNIQGEKVTYRPGSLVYRAATYAHRIELLKGKPAWTLFITGPRIREWGFHCPNGWVHWQEFVDQNDHGNIGRGCGEQA